MRAPTSSCAKVWAALLAASATACGSAGLGAPQPIGTPLGGSGSGASTADGGSEESGTGPDGGDGGLGSIEPCKGKSCSDAGSGSAGKTGTGPDTGATLGECSKDEDCGSGKFCSKTLACIDEGTCVNDGDCAEGEKCKEKVCAPGGDCGGGEFEIERIASNVLIVLDRSCSMRTVVGAAPKWTTAVNAINAMTLKFADTIRWGLEMFPDQVAPDCSQDPTIDVSVSDTGGAAITALLTPALLPADVNYPDGPCVTNIDTAFAVAATEPAFLDKTRKSYALFISDGAQSSGNGCGSPAARDPVTAKTMADMFAAGVPTYVIGFAAASSASSLNLFANSGGAPRSDPTYQFYNAEDAAALDAAITAIAGSVSSCDFGLAEEPKNLDELYVFLDKEKVPRDTTKTDGWDYDATTNQVSLYGPACEALKDGSKTDVDVVFGCDHAPPS